jgi:hypothetical protein
MSPRRWIRRVLIAVVVGATGTLSVPQTASGAVAGPVDQVRAGPAHRDPVLAAAGDIACDPRASGFNRGRGTSYSCRQLAVSNAIRADRAVSAVAALGDVQYYCGGLAAFRASYEPSWGRFKRKTHPAVGNHEYLTGPGEGGEATDCDRTGTATGYFTYFGRAAGRPGRGYYSYRLGRWHVVVLNTTCSAAGGCGRGSRQEAWLRRDLAAHPTRCTLAYWHIPFWSSGGRAAPDNSRPFMHDLWRAHADVVLTAHDHIYQRFAPQGPAGRLRRTGIREWVVGTGGANHTEVAVRHMRHSRALNASTFGYLRLTLRPRSYRWKFVPVGGTYTDSGHARCH